MVAGERGVLYVVGVGPGDPELLTLKAVRVLKSVQFLCVPKGREKGESLALSIVRKALSLEDKVILEAYFPMKKTKDKHGKGSDKFAEKDRSLSDQWDKNAGAIAEKLNSGQDVAFLTLGDPSIYSTFFYLSGRISKLCPGLEMVIVPGVSSINAAASRAGVSLGLADERIAVLPANYAEDLEDVLGRFDTVVLMKVHRAFDRVIQVLEKKGLHNKITFVQKAGMEGERIFHNPDEVRQEDLDYFSIGIIKK